METATSSKTSETSTLHDIITKECIVSVHWYSIRHSDTIPHFLTFFICLQACVYNVPVLIHREILDIGTCRKINSFSYNSPHLARNYNKVVAIRHSGRPLGSVIEAACCDQVSHTIFIQVRKDNGELQINCTSVTVLMTVEVPYYTSWNKLNRMCIQMLAVGCDNKKVCFI
jgi:hypothetical protein